MVKQRNSMIENEIMLEENLATYENSIYIRKLTNLHSHRSRLVV